MTVTMECEIGGVEQVERSRPSTARLRLALREAPSRRERMKLWKILCFRRAHPGLSFGAGDSGTKRRFAKRRGRR